MMRKIMLAALVMTGSAAAAVFPAYAGQPYYGSGYGHYGYPGGYGHPYSGAYGHPAPYYGGGAAIAGLAVGTAVGLALAPRPVYVTPPPVVYVAPSVSYPQPAMVYAPGSYYYVP